MENDTKATQLFYADDAPDLKFGLRRLFTDEEWSVFLGDLAAADSESFDE